MALAFWCLLSARFARADDLLVHLNAQALSQTPTVSLSPSGKFVAIQDSRGSLWLLEPAKRSKKRLSRSTHFLSSSELVLRWALNDHVLLVTRHGLLSMYSAPGGKEQSSPAGAEPLSFAQLSPDGKYLSFVRDHNLWLIPTVGGRLRALSSNGNANLLIGEPDPLYAYEFGVEEHYWWAPDSSAIAFIETEFQNADHYPLPGHQLPALRLNTINVNSGALINVYGSSEEYPYLLRVAWHPDSRHLAYYRMNRLQNEAELTFWGEEGQRKVLTDHDAYWVNITDAPLFVGDGTSLVATSERSGERRAYLCNIEDQSVTQFSPAGLDVYKLFRAEDSRHGVYVEGVTGDKQDLHLFRLSFDGESSKQLTIKPGWHQVNVGSRGNYYVDTFSSAVEPPSIWWHSETGSVTELSPPDKALEPAPNNFIPIKTHDNVLLPARLFRPRDFDSGKKYPLIIYTFSGPRDRVVRNSWDGWQMAWNRYLVAKGYLVLAVDLRGSAGYGHLYEEYIHYRFGAQETVDLREVVSFLGRQSYVDSNRLGIWGCDYGGHTVVHAMLEFPHGLKAGYADSPITDWKQYDAYFTERYLGLPNGKRVEYDDSSPLESARRITGELLVATSRDNPVIRREQMTELQTKMNEVKGRSVASKLHVIDEPDADYRQNPEQLARLLESILSLFDQMQ